MTAKPPCPRLDLESACNALNQGKMVIFPTETFYGIGCDAMNPDAVGSIFSLKRRALTMPLPVVIGSMDHLERIAEHVSPQVRKLMEAFWPGPLSIVLPARPDVPDLLTANAARIAVRYSPHPAVLRLCRATDKVLVASSANISGTPSCARLEELEPELARGVAGVYLEGEEPAGGLPSTVVDLTETRAGNIIRILRPGVITRRLFEKAGYTVLEDSGSLADGGGEVVSPR